MQQEMVYPRTTYSPTGRTNLLPWHGVAGLALVALAWVVSWEQIRPFAQFYFFPIWLGYILLVDSLVLRRRGTSLLRQGLRPFVVLFVISAAFWWLFEGLNVPVGNWRYLGVSQYGTLTFSLLATLPFSTVLPAVLETASLIGSFLPPERYLALDQTAPPRNRLAVLLTLGVLALTLPFIWPHQMYGLIWVSLVLILEPLNWLGGRPSVFRQLAAGRVMLLYTLFGAGLICGFFWEMWNYYSYPKWVYVLPGVQAPHLFEMPLPGFLGYLPFSLELYAMYNLVLGLAHARSRFEMVLQLPSLAKSRGEC